MSTASSEGSSSSAHQMERPHFLSAALSSATKTVAVSSGAMRWSSGALKAGELPPELTKNRAHLAIYLLPRAFSSLNCQMASEFAELWQFGASKRRKIERISRSYPKTPLLICRYRLNEFSGSETIQNVVTGVLQKATDTLPEMASGEKASDDRWLELRRIAKEFAARHKKDDRWSESTRSFIGVDEDPVVRLEKRAITTETFLLNGESPFSSDAYGAIGSFAARAYLEAVVSKKAGDDRVFVKPVRVGVRLWDDYDFNDFSAPDWMKSKLMSKVFGRLTSQFLGVWKDTDSDDVVVLQNSDFRSFREQFMPVYNSQVPAPPRKMTCEDFASVSDFAVKDVAGNVEYPLPAL